MGIFRVVNKREGSHLTLFKIKKGGPNDCRLCLFKYVSIVTRETL